MSTKPRVLVAMSGGVDSSLTAALLVQQGYDVIGATMQIWDKDVPENDAENRGCCSLSAVDDARRVADKIGIPYYVLNFREMFESTVIDYFVAEYGAGKTPNPCIACNRYVKFEGLLQKALALGAEYVATGHYARIGYDDHLGRHTLSKGIDHTKDQSYALYHLNQNTLKHFLMPLGDYTKVRTRELAAEFGLSVANKPESQEICFVPDDDYKGFLADKSPDSLRPGNIIDIHGKIVGQHQGLPLYTVGQRKGLGLATGQPLYVVKLDFDNNQIIVGSNEDVFSSELIAEDLNFIAIDHLEAPITVSAKIRYGSREGVAVVSPLPEGRVHVKFREPQRAITPGQSVVFYDGDMVIGGGIIKNSI
ncbi:tRNA 2-thiouridine(34) synthase MnmA [Pelosinus propionicus]|uniref:tRNA-specific 2-thiouridylase MnmA n=1 Tax=Pelosinus propionicus DSM 13327 TaxID=1123291 RepID=A0A1I4KSS9_9FIRM|nr:tRNA 2-thiouridine(34) synthase MnmA [Pelosinus propionicus]SFL81609.1 tRNA (5-methylaminomethyl-2-thiouridylate)-methyltransferase [Pelosinus propionicus DSM 13327]